jgi:predicted nucleotide-binding protein (sugar kinase/HSP70/actin superfamily)
MLHRTRPYEVVPGESDALFMKYVAEVCALLPAHKEYVERHKLRALFKVEHLSPIEEVLARAQADFENVPRQAGKRPLVGVVGEFYVRINDSANQNVVRKIEQHGGEAWLAPATEFFIYSNRIGQIYSRERYLDTLRKKYLIDWVASWLNQKLAMRDEHKLVHAAQPALADYHDISTDEVMEEGSKYMHYSFGGEAICSIGKAEDFAKRGLAGVIAVKPFNCMPGNVVSALSYELRRRNSNIPFLNLDYDGFMDSSRDMKLANFMCQVRERFAGRQAAVSMEAPARDIPSGEPQRL